MEIKLTREEEGKKQTLEAEIRFEMKRPSWSSQSQRLLQYLFVGFFFFLLCVVRVSSSPRYEFGGRRALLSFKETPKGGNATYDCSLSGACVPCLYSEKKLLKYRCSETGYRIPLKCVEVQNSKKVKKSQKNRSTLENLHDETVPLLESDIGEETRSLTQRNLLENSSAGSGDVGLQSYITYRSCIPAANEEKLSVFGFEGIVFVLLLASGTFIYFRRKRSLTTMPGVAMTRIPTNPRF